MREREEKEPLFETAGGSSPALQARDRAARTACARQETKTKTKKSPAIPL